MKVFMLYDIPMSIEAIPKKMQAIQDMATPTKSKDIKKLSRRIATFNRFISKSAESCLPLFKAIKKENKFKWTDECHEAFDGLKECLTLVFHLAVPGNASLYL